jgi:ABC-type sugar transport system ATPase subunit
LVLEENASPQPAVLDPSSTGPRGELLLELSDAWKSFGHVIALCGAHLRAYGGEILALVGDNGAGKSTLLKVFSGLYALDKGSVKVNGVAMDRADPRRALRLGVSTVFQDLALVETLDVATNMYLGQPIVRGGLFINHRAMVEGAALTLRDLKVRMPSVRIPVGELSGGQRQSVAIARAVLRDRPIVLLDEPTAALGVRERQQVGEILDELRLRGKGVILVSHDLEFVFEHSDWIQVMRLGAVRGVRRTEDTSHDEVIALITGLDPGESAKRPEVDE